MSRKLVLTLLVFTLRVLSGVGAGPKKQKALPPMPDDDGEAGPSDRGQRRAVRAAR
jgi:hypothetical protein